MLGEFDTTPRSLAILYLKTSFYKQEDDQILWYLSETLIKIRGEKKLPKSINLSIDWFSLNDSGTVYCNVLRVCFLSNNGVRNEKDNRIFLSFDVGIHLLIGGEIFDIKW